MSNLKWCYVAQFPADLVTFIEEFLYGKLHFLCSGYIKRPNILPLIGNNETGLKLFTSYLLSLLCICTTLVFFQWHWKTPVSRHNGKIICEGLQIGLPLNLNILLWQWAITPFFNFWQCICSTNTFSKIFRNVSWL